MYTFLDITYRIWDIPYGSSGDKDIPSSQSKILDNCFVISTANVSYEPLKHIYGVRDKLGYSVAQRSPKDKFQAIL